MSSLQLSQLLQTWFVHSQNKTEKVGENVCDSPSETISQKATCTHVELARAQRGENQLRQHQEPEAQRVRVQRGEEEDQLEAAFSFFLGKGKIKFHQHAESQLIFPNPKTVGSYQT